MSDFDPDDPRLTVVCTDGTTIGCANFTAKAGGVLLTEDLKRNRVFGFVPHERVRFVLPTERAEAVLDGESAEADEGAEEFEDSLKRLPGLGSTYAKRLRSAGYTSIEDVFDADPSVLAEETGANEDRTEEWVEHAESERAGGDGESERGPTLEEGGEPSTEVDAEREEATESEASGDEAADGDGEEEAGIEGEAADAEPEDGDDDAAGDGDDAAEAEDEADETEGGEGNQNENEAEAN